MLFSTGLFGNNAFYWLFAAYYDLRKLILAPRWPSLLYELVNENI